MSSKKIAESSASSILGRLKNDVSRVLNKENGAQTFLDDYHKFVIMHCVRMPNLMSIEIPTLNDFLLQNKDKKYECPTDLALNYVPLEWYDTYSKGYLAPLAPLIANVKNVNHKYQMLLSKAEMNFIQYMESVKTTPSRTGGNKDRPLSAEQVHKLLHAEETLDQDTVDKAGSLLSEEMSHSKRFEKFVMDYNQNRVRTEEAIKVGQIRLRVIPRNKKEEGEMEMDFSEYLGFRDSYELSDKYDQQERAELINMIRFFDNARVRVKRKGGDGKTHVINLSKYVLEHERYVRLDEEESIPHPNTPDKVRVVSAGPESVSYEIKREYYEKNKEFLLSSGFVLEKDFQKVYVATDVSTQTSSRITKAQYEKERLEGHSKAHSNGLSIAYSQSGVVARPDYLISYTQTCEDDFCELQVLKSELNKEGKPVSNKEIYVLEVLVDSSSIPNAISDLEALQRLSKEDGYASLALKTGEHKQFLSIYQDVYTDEGFNKGHRFFGKKRLSVSQREASLGAKEAETLYRGFFDLARSIDRLNSIRPGSTSIQKQMKMLRENNPRNVSDRSYENAKKALGPRVMTEEDLLIMSLGPTAEGSTQKAVTSRGKESFERKMTYDQWSGEVAMQDASRLLQIYSAHQPEFLKRNIKPLLEKPAMAPTTTILTPVRFRPTTPSPPVTLSKIESGITSQENNEFLKAVLTDEGAKWLNDNANVLWIVPSNSLFNSNQRFFLEHWCQFAYLIGEKFNNSQNSTKKLGLFNSVFIKPFSSRTIGQGIEAVKQVYQAIDGNPDDNGYNVKRLERDGISRGPKHYGEHVYVGRLSIDYADFLNNAKAVRYIEERLLSLERPSKTEGVIIAGFKNPLKDAFKFVFESLLTDEEWEFLNSSPHHDEIDGEIITDPDFTYLAGDSQHHPITMNLWVEMRLHNVV